MTRQHIAMWNACLMTIVGSLSTGTIIYRENPLWLLPQAAIMCVNIYMLLINTRGLK